MELTIKKKKFASNLKKNINVKKIFSPIMSNFINIIRIHYILELVIK